MRSAAGGADCCAVLCGVVQARSASERASVQQADSTGLVVEGQRALQHFSTSFIEEALLISDLFDLSEYAALELLMTGASE